MKKKVHFEPASAEELDEGRRGLAAWFADLPAEIRAEIEAQASAQSETNGASKPAPAPEPKPARSSRKRPV
jgi:hypothetical protein